MKTRRVYKGRKKAGRHTKRRSNARRRSRHTKRKLIKRGGKTPTYSSALKIAKRNLSQEKYNEIVNKNCNLTCDDIQILKNKPENIIKKYLRGKGIYKQKMSCYIMKKDECEGANFNVPTPKSSGSYGFPNDEEYGFPDDEKYGFPDNEEKYGFSSTT